MAPASRRRQALRHRPEAQRHARAIGALVAARLRLDGPQVHEPVAVERQRYFAEQRVDAPGAFEGAAGTAGPGPDGERDVVLLASIGAGRPVARLPGADDAVEPVEPPRRLVEDARPAEAGYEIGAASEARHGRRAQRDVGRLAGAASRRLHTSRGRPPRG